LLFEFALPLQHTSQAVEDNCQATIVTYAPLYLGAPFERIAELLLAIYPGL